MIVLGSLLRTDDNSRPESQCRFVRPAVTGFLATEDVSGGQPGCLRRKQYNLLDRYARNRTLPVKEILCSIGKNVRQFPGGVTAGAGLSDYIAPFRAAASR